MRIRKLDVESYKERNICPRCEGKGEFPRWRDNKGGVCFRCWGHGKYYSPNGKYNIQNYEPNYYTANKDTEVIEEIPKDFKRRFKAKITKKTFNLEEARRKLRETEEEIID
jgi:hypothetical protein